MDKTQERPLAIAVVDDHAVVRRGIMDIIADAWPDCRFIEAGSLAALWRLIAPGDGPEEPPGHGAGAPDLILLDISLPDGNGLSALPEILAHRPGLPVIMLSMHQEAEYARRALALGASGYLGKNSAPGELAGAIREALSGGRPVSADLEPDILPSRAASGLAALSRREREVMRLLAEGERMTDIAQRLGVSVKTASTYRSRIMKKLRLTTTADFFRFVHEKTPRF